MDLLANEIAEKIRRKIERHEYRQGEHLAVRRLCEEFGASETPVKQAMNQLVAAGLLVTVPKCGIMVRTFSFEDMKNVLEARLMIELFCGRSAIQKVREDSTYARALSDSLQECNDVISVCIRDFTQENYYATIPCDRMLHSLIVKSTDNSQIVSMYENLNSHAGMFVGYEVHPPDVMENIKREHTEIVLSLLRSDERDLSAAIEAHVRSTIELYRNVNYGRT